MAESAHTTGQGDANNASTKGTTSSIQLPSLPPRPISRSSTFKTPLARRRSSILSDFTFDDARTNFRASTDSLLLPRASLDSSRDIEESSHWHSAPLVFAVLPAVAGLLFKNGSAFVTDILLLVLAAIFLNWSVRLPWEWYHNAQSVRLVEEESMPLNGGMKDSILEESSGEEDESQANDILCSNAKGVPIRSTGTIYPERDAAVTELRWHELLALLFCCIGPLLGALLLHTIRSQLSRPSEGLVSDYNLTIFVLAAEFRPCAHLLKMLQMRTLHLQRIVKRSEQADQSFKQVEMQDLAKRIEDMESSFASSLVENSQTNPDGKGGNYEQVTQAVRQSLQPQLDALNRAVRRYEKRATTQTMVTEARLQDLEIRLKDALSLAAVAAQHGQKPGVVGVLLEWISHAFMLPLQVFWLVCLYPLHVVGSLFRRLKVFLLGSDKRKTKGRERHEHSSMNGHRVHSRTRR